ncbi:MAG: hypothetical protein OXC44_03545 [Proteobacteria bacterium]|nr:hypothetical protein [Pseudomonadota bacterium]
MNTTNIPQTASYDLSITTDFHAFQCFYHIHHWPYQIGYYTPIYPNLFPTSLSPSSIASSFTAVRSLKLWLQTFASQHSPACKNMDDPCLWIPNTASSCLSSARYAHLLTYKQGGKPPALQLAPFLVSQNSEMIYFWLTDIHIDICLNLATHRVGILHKDANNAIHTYCSIYKRQKLRLLLLPFKRKVFAIDAKNNHTIPPAAKLNTSFLVALRNAFPNEQLWLNLNLKKVSCDTTYLSTTERNMIKQLGFITHSLPSEPCLSLIDLQREYDNPHHRSIYMGRRL